jgi:hypothetical protein
MIKPHKQIIYATSETHQNYQHICKGMTKRERVTTLLSLVKVDTPKHHHIVTEVER